jgi:hypothetical protein
MGIGILIKPVKGKVEQPMTELMSISVSYGSRWRHDTSVPYQGGGLLYISDR